MAANKLQWKRIAKGEKLPCDSLLMKKDGTITSVVSGAGVKVGQDAYYLPVGELKSFPKEKSEDERMIQYFKDLAPFDKAEELYMKYGFSHKDAIAWLEKQGEHKKFRDSIQVGDKVTRNEEGVLVNLSQLNRVAKKDEKQGEQNPVNSIWHDMTENPEGDVNDRTLVVFEDGYSTTSNALLHIGFGTSKSYKWAYVNDILRLTSNTKQSEQKPTDKVEQKFKVGDIVRASKSKGAMLKIVGITDYCYNCVTCTTNDEYSFGFDIQDEFELVEQNPAWSEEDEHMFNTIANSLNIEKVERVWHTTEKEVDNWLKSLKDRYTWKPSEEQMKLIKDIVFKDRQKITRKELAIFHSIYNDLKKLK